MNHRERFHTAITLGEPDRPPHFEEIFDLNAEAFGREFPDGDAIAKATGQERDRLLHECVEVYALIAERFDWDAVCMWHPWGGPQLLELVRIAKKELGGTLMIGGYIGWSIHAIDTIKDYMQFAVDLYEHPEKLHAEAKVMSDNALQLGRDLGAAGADFVNLVSDVADNHGPFLRPEMFYEFVTPYMHRHIPPLRAEGLYVIQHSDGNLTPILDAWIAPGQHMLHSLDPMAGMDMAEVKQRTRGRVALMGNVQCSLLQDGPDEAIRRSARYALDHGAPGGGYFFSSSNTIFPGLPLRNYEVMLDEFRCWQQERCGAGAAPANGRIP